MALRHTLQQRQSQMKSMQGRVAALELEANDATEKARHALEDQAKLVRGASALTRPTFAMLPFTIQRTRGVRCVVCECVPYWSSGLGAVERLDDQTELRDASTQPTLQDELRHQLQHQLNVAGRLWAVGR